MDRSAQVAVVGAVTAGLYTLVQHLAQQRVDLDAAQTAAHGKATATTSVTVPTSATYAPRPPGRAHVLVYWPTTARAAGAQHVYGWRWVDTAGVCWLVVAGIAGGPCDRRLDGVPSATLLGTTAPGGHAHGTASLRLRLGEPYPTCTLSVPHAASTEYNVSVYLYTPPDPLCLASLALDSYATPVGARAPSRLEQLVAMDTARWHLRRSHASDGMYEAVRRMNMSQWALGVPALCRAPPVPTVPLYPTPSAVLNRVQFHLATVLAWPRSRFLASGLVAVVHAGDADALPGALASARAASLHAWNRTLLLVCDLALGALFSYGVTRYTPLLLYWSTRALACVEAGSLRHVLDWLVHWPLGIKLNTQLAAFSRDVLGGLAEVHTVYVLAPLRTSLPWLLAVSGALGRWAGVSMALAFVLDVTTIAGVHLHLAYALLRRVYLFFWGAALSLLDMFRGKKRNPLHHGRVDDAQYDVDQLFLGTILFTLVVFLFPTVLLFYATCAGALLLLLGVQAAVAAGVGALSTWPAATCVWRLVLPQRLPAGIVVEAADGQATLASVCGAPLSAAIHAGLAPVYRIPSLVYAAWRGGVLYSLPPCF